MSSNINEVNVKFLPRKEDGYCCLANIPELVGIAEAAGKKLMNHIMQKFLDGKLSKEEIKESYEIQRIKNSRKIKKKFF